MLYLINLLLIASTLGLCAEAYALPERTGLNPPTASLNLVSEHAAEMSELRKPFSVQDVFGITYFSYFYGPGFHPDKAKFNPNNLGKQQHDGIYFQNQLSIRYKFSKNLALDFQTRFKLILNNSNQNPAFKPFLWEAPRIGVSGRLIGGDDWSIIGAVNTDFPYFFPAPFSGYQSEQRKIIFTPGMFATLKYEPKLSRWSVFSVLSPRYLLYADRNVSEPQLLNQGSLPQNKPELILAFQPAVSYKLDSRFSLSLGTSLEYRKQVVSDWNPFHASLFSNGNSKAWRLEAIPVNLGLTIKVTSYLTLFPFVSAYPIAAQRIHAVTREQATFLETASMGMWLYGTIF